MSQTNDRPFAVAAISGSLRDGSLNTALLQAAIELAPPGVVIRELPVGDLPFYNPQLDREDGLPETVARFRDALRAADALLIATPEYNHGLPAQLKNAIDWGSRPVRAEAPLFEMPVGIMGASPGIAGTARAQQHLKLVLMAAGSHPMGAPTVILNQARDKFDDDRRLVDEPTRQRVRSLLERLVEWAHRLRRVEEDIR